MEEEKKKYYNINFKKLFQMEMSDFSPSEMVVLVVIAKFNRPVTEEEVMAEIERLGLKDKSDEELVEWIMDWKRKKDSEIRN